MSRYSHIRSTIKTTTSYRQLDYVLPHSSYQPNIESFHPSVKTMPNRYINDDFQIIRKSTRNDDWPNISGVDFRVKSYHLEDQNTDHSSNINSKMNFLNYNSMSPYKSSLSLNDSYSPEYNLRHQIISSNFNLYPIPNLSKGHKTSSRVDHQITYVQPTSFRLNNEKELLIGLQQQFSLKNGPNGCPSNSQTLSKFSDYTFDKATKVSRNLKNIRKLDTRVSLIDAICSKYRPETEKNPDWEIKFNSVAELSNPVKTKFSKDTELGNLILPSEERKKVDSPPTIDISYNFNISPTKNAISTIDANNKKDLFDQLSSSSENDKKPKKVAQKMNKSVILKDGNNKMIDLDEKLAKFRETISIVRKTEEDFGDLLKSDTETELKPNEGDKNSIDLKGTTNDMLSEPSLIFNEQEQRSEQLQGTK